MVELTINGKHVSAPDGSTIMEAAKLAGISIPHLCHCPGIHTNGSCRIGTKRMLEMLQRMTNGEGELEDIDNLATLAGTVSDTAMCALGQTAPNPVLTTLKYFRDEYVAHVRDKRCPAHVCAALKEYCIDPEKCKGCGMCAKGCPVGAISGEKAKPHVIDGSACIKCGSCKNVCRFDAVILT